MEIVELEKRPDDENLLARIFRTIHAIKGSCGFIGLPVLSAVAHAAENVPGQMREGAIRATPESISPVLEAVDTIKDLLRGLDETGQEHAQSGTCPGVRTAVCEITPPAVGAFPQNRNCARSARVRAENSTSMRQLRTRGSRS